MTEPLKNDNSNRPVTAAAKNDNSSKKATAAKQESLDSAASAEAAKKAEAERIDNELKQLRAANATQAKQLKDVTDEVQKLRHFKQGIDRQVLPQLNNLDPRMHPHRFNLINAHSREAIDTSGGMIESPMLCKELTKLTIPLGAGRECRSKKHDVRNESQAFYLEKVDPKDPQSAWTISSREGYLEFNGNTENHQPICSVRKTDSSKKNQEWNIGYSPDWPGRHR